MIAITAPYARIATGLPGLPHPDAALIAAWRDLRATVAIFDSLEPGEDPAAEDKIADVREKFREAVATTPAATLDGVLFKLLLLWAGYFDDAHALVFHDSPVTPDLLREMSRDWRDRLGFDLIQDILRLRAVLPNGASAAPAEVRR